MHSAESGAAFGRRCFGLVCTDTETEPFLASLLPCLYMLLFWSGRFIDTTVKGSYREPGPDRFFKLAVPEPGSYFSLLPEAAQRAGPEPGPEAASGQTSGHSHCGALKSLPP